MQNASSCLCYYKYYATVSGVLVSGHENGSILVWHNIVQFYLSALKSAAVSRRAATAAAAAEEKSAAGDKNDQEKKMKKKHHKKKEEKGLEVAAPLSTTLHWHAHAGEYLILFTDIRNTNILQNWQYQQLNNADHICISNACTPHFLFTLYG